MIPLGRLLPGGVAAARLRVDAAEGREGIGALAPGPSAGPRSRRARAAREPVREARRGRPSGGIRTVRSVSEEVRGSSRRGRLDHRRRHGSCGCYGSCWERVSGGSGRRVRSYRAAGVGILNWTQSEFRRGKGDDVIDHPALAARSCVMRDARAAAKDQVHEIAR